MSKRMMCDERGVRLPSKTLAVVLLLVVLECVPRADGMLDSLKEKTVSSKKPLDKKCLEYLSANSNVTQLERCEFFKCFEERFPCGNKYWIMNWGYKYCTRYADQEFIDKFTAVGKQMLAHVNKCLPKAFQKFYKSKKPIKCKKLNQEAFDAQGKCYVEVQDMFCVAFPENMNLFMNVLDTKDLLNFDSLKMIRETAEKCDPKIDLMSLVGKK